MNAQEWFAQQDPAKILVTLGQLADLLGVSEDTINQWARDRGMPRGPHRGTYPLQACLFWRVEMLKALSTKGAPGELDEARLGLINAQRQGHELNNARTRGELLAREPVERAILNAFRAIDDALAAAVPRIAAAVAPLDDPAAAERRMREETRAVRREMAGAIRRLSAELGTGSGPAA